jgi:hypothetical protein
VQSEAPFHPLSPAGDQALAGKASLDLIATAVSVSMGGHFVKNEERIIESQRGSFE